MRQMAIVIFTIIWLTPSLVFAQIKDGFRDMRWGDAPTADFERVDRGPSKPSLYGSPEAVKYRRRSDKLAIGEVHLGSISYYFEDNKLREVFVYVNSEAPSTDFWAIADVLKATYGAPEINENRLNGGGVFSRWNEGNTKIFLTYRQTPVDLLNGNDLTIIDKAYAERVSQDKAAKDQKENNRKGRDDL